MTRIVIPYSPRGQQIDMHLGMEAKRWSAIVAHRRFGKALDLNTPVPMADGSWSTMGDLKDGDRIIGSDGFPVTVVVAHPVMFDRECFELEFESGERIVADADHLWVTTRKKDRHRPVEQSDGRRVNIPREAAPRTTREIYDTLRSRGEFNHRVKVAGPAELPEQALPIDPYLLGVWLGDGTSRRPEVTTMDKEVVEFLKRICEEQGWSFGLCGTQNAGKATTYVMNNGFSKVLKDNELIKNKHIPGLYLKASIKQRRELLSGLLDTDGTINKAGNYCEIIQKSKAMADGIEMLLLSLGMIARVSIKTVKGVDYYRVGFRPRFNPFNVSHKSQRYVEAPGNRWQQSIVNVVKVESRPVRCITVDAEDSQFCVGRKYTVTHNTVCVVNHLIKQALTTQKRKPFFAYLAPFYNQAKAIAWEYLLYYTAAIPGRQVNRSEMSITLTLPDYGLRENSSTIRLFGADNPDSLRGLYFDGVVLDEFGDMKAEVWDTVLRPALADRLGWGAFIGTPKGRNKFWEICTKAKEDPDWFTAVYRADETGVLPPEELAALKAQMSPSQYAQEFECSFEAAIQGAYYANELQMARIESRVRDFNIETGIPVNTVWDLGMDDYTAIIFYQNVAREVRIVDFYEANGEGLSHYAKVLQDKGYLYGDHWLPHDVEVKELGTGKSRKESLEGMGLRVLTGPRLPVEDGIEAARKIFAMCWFRESTVMPLVDHLQLYRRVWDDRLGVFRDRPVHDIHSHAADAFRYLALTHEFKTLQPKRRPQQRDWRTS